MRLKTFCGDCIGLTRGSFVGLDFIGRIHFRGSTKSLRAILAPQRLYATVRPSVTQLWVRASSARLLRLNSMSKRKHTELQPRDQAEQEEKSRRKRAKLVPTRSHALNGNITPSSELTKDEKSLRDPAAVESKSEKKKKKKKNKNEASVTAEDPHNGVDAPTKQAGRNGKEPESGLYNGLDEFSSKKHDDASTTASSKSGGSLANKSQQLIVHPTSAEDGPKKKKKGRQLKREDKKLQNSFQSSWAVSNPVGGLQADLDPVFSTDES